MLFLYWVVNKNENKFGNLGQRAEQFCTSTKTKGKKSRKIKIHCDAIRWEQFLRRCRLGKF